MPDKAFLSAAILAAVLIGNTTQAAEINEITFDNLPDSVKNTVLGLIEQKQISKIAKIDDNSLIRYEIEADKTENNKPVTSWDIVIANNGKLMKLAKEVPYYTLTYPQMQTIEKRYPGIKVTEAESVDIHFFDVIGDVDGQPVKFRFYEDGAIEDQTQP